MSLGISQGTEIILKAEGEDEEEAINKLESFIKTEMEE
jgi:phosphotransferase system HPr (HPr) family protein